MLQQVVFASVEEVVEVAVAAGGIEPLVVNPMCFCHGLPHQKLI